ncbi:MAG: hypothetical protein JXQ85_14010 [Cognatishimia sp.]|uniref:hypothetical protein n=1 Tax=Cognatishimia sp. TaxID=2211648 RepID=UPI003B8D7585
MPNSIAYLVLALWPLVMFVFFKRLPVRRALIWSFLCGYLILPPYPTGFDFPLLPPLNKETLPNIAAAFLVIVVAKERIDFWPKSTVMRVLLATFVFSPIFTVFTNGEPVLFAASGLRGLYLMDIVALIFNQLIMVLGFVLARQFLFKQEHLRELMMALFIAGIVYAFPMLLEVRLSPQLNVWIYGYFPHSFEQMVRGGGFRAAVFLAHGIWAAMFIFVALGAALILWRNEPKRGRQWYFIGAIFLAVVLVLNKTLGPVVYGVVLGTILLFSNWRIQARIAVVLAVLVIAYPMAKTVNFVPEDKILSIAEKASVDRANSLRFRFQNENILLDRALEKPLFGWGTWGRNHIHDPVTGRILTVSDGRWIVTIGVFGLVGFLAEFGLLAVPIFLFAFYAFQSQNKDAQRWRGQNRVEIPVKKSSTERLTRFTPSALGGGIALLLAVNLVDQLPNATLTPVTWLLAGALLGYAERIAMKAQNIETPRKQLLVDGKKKVTLESGPRTIL